MQLSTILLTISAAAAGVEALGNRAPQTPLATFKQWKETGTDCPTYDSADGQVDIYDNDLKACHAFDDVVKTIKVVDVQPVNGTYCDLRTFDDSLCESKAHRAVTGKCASTDAEQGWGAWRMICLSV